MHDKIKALRKEVDGLDSKIVRLIAERCKITDRIGHIKKQLGLAILDTARENEIVTRLKHISPENIESKFIDRVYRQILLRSKISQLMHEYPNTNRRNVKDVLKKRPIIIAGPCAVESEEQIARLSRQLSHMGVHFLRGGAFKPRSSPDSFQGLGLEGLIYMRKAANLSNMFIVSEIMDSTQLDLGYDLIDIIQVGSRSMTSYSLLKEIGRVTAREGKPVLLKRGMSATITEFLNAAKYIFDQGNPNVLLCLRGIRTFEQTESQLRYTPDLADILELKERSNLPVLFDPSHATGRSEHIMKISKAAMVCGADGLMIETHDHPDKALVDGQQSIMPNVLKELMAEIGYTGD